MPVVDDAHQPKLLEIHVRHIARPDGDDHADVLVLCPCFRKPLPIDDCASCDYYGGLSIDASGRESFLRCKFREGDPRPAHTPDSLKPRPRRRGRVAAAGSARETPISALMSRKVIAASVDLSLDAVSELLLENAISGVPVTDAAGRPIGMVTKTDLVRARYGDGDTVETIEGSERRDRRRRDETADMGGFHEQTLVRSTVGDVMTRVAFTLPEEATVLDATALMTREGVHRVPVVDMDGKVVGILSALDVIRWTAERES